mgnify:CR=1 FL=1
MKWQKNNDTPKNSADTASPYMSADNAAAIVSQSHSVTRESLHDKEQALERIVEVASDTATSRTESVKEAFVDGEYASSTPRLNDSENIFDHATRVSQVS